MEEEVTMSKINFKGITLRIRPIRGIYSLRPRANVESSRAEYIKNRCDKESTSFQRGSKRRTCVDPISQVPLHYYTVADLEEGPRGPASPPPLILSEKRRND